MDENACTGPNDCWVAGVLTDTREGAGWHALGQSWRADGHEAGFQPGRARIRWSPEALFYDAVFTGAGQANRARTLNELTWESGDVCEIFLQAGETGHYVEIHVTPENHRLQLRFPPDGIAAVRTGRARLEEFMVADPSWVESSSVLSASHWEVCVRVPSTILNPRSACLGPDTHFRTAVCRYDCGARATPPILSSTARLSAPSFHSPGQWSRLQLSTRVPDATPPRQDAAPGHPGQPVPATTFPSS